MKHILTLEKYQDSKSINEKVKMNTSVRNGKTLTSQIAGETDNLKEFEKLIMNIPDTVSRVDVQSNASVFGPSKERFEKLNDSKRKQIISIVRDVTKQFKDKGDPIKVYSLSSFYGVNPNEANDPFYIQYQTKGTGEFAKRMKDSSSLD